MNHRYTRRLLVGSCILVAMPLCAQQASSSFSLGAAAISSASPYRGYDEKVWPIPAVTYESDRFYFEGINGGMYVVRNKAYDVSINASLGTNYFDPSDTTDPKLKRLAKRNFSLMTGVRGRFRGQWGQVETDFGHDILGNSVGDTAQVEYGYPMREGQLTLVPSAGESWQNARYNRYYFGVSHSQASVSALEYYAPSATWSPYLKLAGNYRFNAQWNGFFQVRYTHLATQISDSPMVATRSLASFIAGFGYRF